MGARRGDFRKIFLGRKIFQENCLEITQNWLNSPRRGRNFWGPKIFCREKSLKNKNIVFAAGAAEIYYDLSQRRLKSTLFQKFLSL